MLRPADFVHAATAASRHRSAVPSPPPPLFFSSFPRLVSYRKELARKDRGGQISTLRNVTRKKKKGSVGRSVGQETRASQPKTCLQNVRFWANRIQIKSTPTCLAPQSEQVYVHWPLLPILLTPHNDDYVPEREENADYLEF